MSRVWIVLLLLLLLRRVTWVTAQITSDAHDESCPSNNTEHFRRHYLDHHHHHHHHHYYPSPAVPACTLYVAPSTIAGAGLGTFAGVDFSLEEIMGDGDVVIPLYDVEYHLQALGNDVRSNLLDPTRDYSWQGLALGMQYESSQPQDSIIGVAYGINTIVNCHPALVNAEKGYPSYDWLNLHRSKDPGIGAFTPYDNAPTIATHHIAAGSEVFKSYGDDWFLERRHTLGVVALSHDYDAAEFTLQKLQHLLDHRNISHDIRSDLYERLIRSNPFKTTSPTLLAMPNEYHGFQYIVKNSIRDYYQQSAMRTQDYLQQHGRCADGIESKRSTIRQAGRGAFAKRYFANNSIVAGTPFMFHATDDLFKLYAGNWMSQTFSEFHPDQHVGYQLMYNYCWRHEHYQTVSSIVLCPYGMYVNYINHNQSLANVRVQWAKDGDMNHNASLLQAHPRDMYYTAAPKLWLDFVALRDVEVGEEIFMDYGNVWEEAWRKHAAQWNNDRAYPTDYVSAYDWNRMNAKVMLRTSVEQVEQPYPDHFMMVCLPQITNPNYSEYLTSDVCERLWEPFVLGLVCEIVDRQHQPDGSYWYQVKYQNADKDSDEVWTESDWIVREAIKFVNQPYTNDIFLKDAFRQPIGIPDDIFPDSWRGVDYDNEI